MNSQLANDLDQILTVLGKHFVRPSEPVESMGPVRIIVIIASVLFVMWCAYKLSKGGSYYVSPHRDPRVQEAQIEELIAERKRNKARYEAEVDNLEAMYQAVVNPPPKTAQPIEVPINYGYPNRVPPPRKIGGKNNYGPGWVYLIAGDGAHKIGLATDPEARLSNLQTASHKQLAMVHKIKTNNMRALEASLHQKYADKRLNGEWFALDPADVAEICLMRDEITA